MSNKQNDIISDNLYEFHKEAGLVDGGLNEEGEILWIGTDKQWHLYEQIEANYLN